LECVESCWWFTWWWFNRNIKGNIGWDHWLKCDIWTTNVYNVHNDFYEQLRSTLNWFFWSSSFFIGSSNMKLLGYHDRLIIWASYCIQKKGDYHNPLWEILLTDQKKRDDMEFSALLSWVQHVC
jgi:hypothetical protein